MRDQFFYSRNFLAREVEEGEILIVPGLIQSPYEKNPRELGVKKTGFVNKIKKQVSFNLNKLIASEAEYKKDSRFGIFNQALPKQLNQLFIKNQKEAMNYYLQKSFQSNLPFITDEILIGKSKKIQRNEKDVFVKHGCFFIERNSLIIGVAYFDIDTEREDGLILFDE